MRLALLVKFEWLLLLALLPLVMFSTVGGLVILILLPLLWGVRKWVTGRFVPETSLNLPLLALMVTLGMSLLVSPDSAHSVPRAVNLLVGISLFYALVQAVRLDRRHLWGGTIVLLIGGVVMAALGLLAASWNTKLPFLGVITDRVPQIFQFPGTINGVSPNQLAGVLLWVAPVALALAYASLIYRRELAGLMRGTGREWLISLVVWGCALVTLVVLLLAQSRSGFLGLAVAVMFLLAIATRYRNWLLPLLGGLFLLGLVGFVVAGPERALAMIFTAQDINEEALGTTLSLETLSSRQEIWQRALWGIQDFPLTGVGFNMFRHVAPALYPYLQVPEGIDIAHAHNHLLQATLDLGVVGLIAYAALWVTAAWTLWMAWREAEGVWPRVLTAGIAAALIGSFAFGLTDAVALGARAGFFFWLLLGLAAGMEKKGTES